MMNQSLDAPTSRRELRKQDRRQAIVSAARASFLADGYAGMSMSGLLKTLGGSKATLWSYFRSKEELFAAVVEDISGAFRTELDAVLSADGDLEPSVVAFCSTFLQKIASPEGLATWRLVVAESGRFPEVGKIFYERAASRIQAMLQAFLTRQIAKGKLSGEDPARMADTLISLCAGQHTRHLWGFDPPTLDEINENARAFAHCFLQAYSTQK